MRLMRTETDRLLRGTGSLVLWLCIAAWAVSVACGPVARTAIPRARETAIGRPDPLLELAKLDPFAERYRVDHVLKRIQEVPYDPETGFSFVVWGDSRSNAEVCEQLWSEIQKENVVFAINTGDLVSRGWVNEWLEYFFPIIDKYRTIPFLAVIGNHDLGLNRMEFTRIFGVLDYAFDYGNARFVAFDNNDGLSDRQLDWMESVLKAAQNKHKFVFAHKPPGAINKWRYHSFSENADEFCDLMAECKVTMVFFGHIHAYSTAEQDGVDYIVTGGGGAPLHSRYGVMGNVHHYCVVHVREDDVRHEVARLFHGKMVRSSGGNEFYQHPREILPPKVLAAVKEIAPKAEVNDVEIQPREKEKDPILFEVELVESLGIDGTCEINVLVREDGLVMSVEKEVFENELPPDLLRYVREHYPSEIFDEAAKVQEGGNTWLKITVLKEDGAERDLLFRLDGTFLAED